MPRDVAPVLEVEVGRFLSPSCVTGAPRRRWPATAPPRRLTEPVSLPLWTGLGPDGDDPPIRGIRMIRRAEVERRVGLCKTALYRRISTDEFPGPVPIAAGRRAWVEHEVEAWIEHRLDDAADGASPAA